MAENIRIRGERKYPTIMFKGQGWDVNNIKSSNHLELFGNLLRNLDRRFTNMHSCRLTGRRDQRKNC